MGIHLQAKPSLFFLISTFLVWCLCLSVKNLNMHINIFKNPKKFDIKKREERVKFSNDFLSLPAFNLDQSIS